jgi:hypothetical protein
MRWACRDLAAAGALLLVMTAMTCTLASRLAPAVYERPDAWFDADISRVVSNMSDRAGDHYRTKVHPLFSLLTYPPVAALKALGLRRLPAVRAVMVAVAGLWAAALFALLRVIGCRRPEAIVFTLLAALSAGAVFFFSVPETYGLGSLSILLALIVVAAREHRPVAAGWTVAASALTLSYTVTNWMTGLLAAFAAYPRRKAFQLSVNAFAAVVALWGVQKFFFPSAGFFLGDREETYYTYAPWPGRVLSVLFSFLFHSIVMPAFDLVARHPGSLSPTVRESLPGSSGVIGALAVVAWALLLTLGIHALLTLRRQAALRVALGLNLAGQLALHIVYGAETVLYSLHFIPLLVVVAALTTLTKRRALALVLAVVLTVLAGVNNAAMFRAAAGLFGTVSDPSGASSRSSGP